MARSNQALAVVYRYISIIKRFCTIKMILIDTICVYDLI